MEGDGKENIMLVLSLTFTYKVEKICKRDTAGLILLSL
jgi:hypothetical protein